MPPSSAEEIGRVKTRYANAPHISPAVIRIMPDFDATFKAKYQWFSLASLNPMNITSKTPAFDLSHINYMDIYCNKQL